MIDFSDEPATIPSDEVERFCNQPGYSGFGNNGSVRDYFLENSIGRCRYSNVVTAYYRARRPKSHYTNRNITMGQRARELIREAVADLQTSGFDFSQLTADQDGFIYALNVYYAGPVENNWREGLWPHAWQLVTTVNVGSGLKLFDYQFTDMSDSLALGTFVHENGHMLCDYPDLYDYGPESSGVGAFCLMGAGGNINEHNPHNPVHISAYLKRWSGWAKSVVPIQHGSLVSLPATGNEFAIFARNTSEYFIAENRMRAGRDSALPEAALAIWHVEEETGDNSKEQMTPSAHYELSLEQADGLFQLERAPNLIGGNGDLFIAGGHFSDTTTPASRWWDGASSDLEIFDISPAGPVIQFSARIGAGNAETGTLTVSSAPTLAIPDQDAFGIKDAIDVDETVSIMGLEVEYNITHTYRGDLQVELLSPAGTLLLLHERGQGGHANDLIARVSATDKPALATLTGSSVQGRWQLRVSDHAAIDTGILNSWALHFATLASNATTHVIEDRPGLHIPDNDPVGVEATLASTTNGTLTNIEVNIDISHTFIGDLRVALRSPNGNQILLHDNSAAGTDNLSQTYTPETHNALTELLGDSINGIWTLQISDHVGQDTGKLNHWRLSLSTS